jgi:hypothetical protein
MKRAIWFLMIVVLSTLGRQPVAGRPAGQKVLAGVFEPEMITVDEDALYIVEGPEVLVFSLKDLTLLRKIGGRGEGPGELRPADYWYNTVTVLKDAVLVDGYEKTVRFSKDGRLLGEKRKPLGFSRMVPVGENFAGVKLEQFEQGVQYHALHLLNAAGESLRELCRQESPVQQTSRTFEMIPDVLNFAVFENKIFVEKSREGFVLEVFDQRGERLDRIERKTDKIPVSQRDKVEAIEALRSDPFIKRMGYDQFRRLSTLAWPEFLPAIRDFAVADGRLYVRTSRRDGNRDQWLVLDQAGRVLGERYLARIEDAPLLAGSTASVILPSIKIGSTTSKRMSGRTTGSCSSRSSSTKPGP